MLLASLVRQTQEDDRLLAPLALILEIQRQDGSIPWFADGIWDAWNHVECAMALEVMGEKSAADSAFHYLRNSQKPDGSWCGDYGNTAPMVDDLYMSRETAGRFHDTNFVAYCTTGIWHRYASRTDKRDLIQFWPMVRAAMAFVLSHQSAFGDIAWSSEAVNFGPDDSLRAGNASIRKSLECACRIAWTLDQQTEYQKYKAAIRKLDSAFAFHPDRFDRQGKNRLNYAMDWYYPAMTGAMKGHDATIQIREHWERFVVRDLGCRCVSDEPWVTVAESAELVIALAGLGARDIARNLLDMQFSHCDAEGRFWMGYQFEQEIFWPMERPSWTQAAVILATDALKRGSPTESVLVQHS